MIQRCIYTVILAYLVILCNVECRPKTTGSAELPTTPLTKAAKSDNADEINDLTKAVIDAILSTICGPGRTFDLKETSCLPITKGAYYGFGNQSIGK